MDPLRVTILHNPAVDSAGEGADTETKAHERKPTPLVQEQLAKGLRARGHEVRLVVAGPSALELATQVDSDQSDVIFNICESFGDSDQKEPHVPALLELFDKRFTGSGSMAIALAQDKAVTKKLLSFHGINTPRFSVVQAGQVDWTEEIDYPLFVKPANADASIGIDEGSIVHTLKGLLDRLSYVQTEFAAPALIEEFIEGREIYVGVLDGEKPEALPLLEWDFSKVPKGTPKIATSDAKWNESSVAFKAPQVFPEDIPPSVSEAMQKAAIDAFKSLKLRDYGRIDMRLRRAKRTQTARNAETSQAIDGWEFYLIEVNPNPYLIMDGELALAAHKHGLQYPDLIERIVNNAMHRGR